MNTLKNLIDNGLLNNCGTITVINDYTISDVFTVDDEMLNVYFEDDVIMFPLDNEITFNGSIITIKNKCGVDFDLSFMSHENINPKQFVNN